jgi:YbbR domain-containing protein
MSTRIWPFRHFDLKLWSIALAAMLWMVISGGEAVERGIRVPLELQQFPAGLELQSEPPALIDVRVRGDSTMLSRVGPGDIVALLDLRGARPGQRLYQITPEQVRAPFGIDVVQVNPPTLTLVFENSAVRRLPIVPPVEGEPAPGFVAGTPVVSPETVEAVGPEGAVAQASNAITEPVSVAGAHADVTESVTVGFADPAIRLRTPQVATVTVPVRPGAVERTLENRPVRLRNLGPGLSAHANPPAADVVLRGTTEAIEATDLADVNAFVDLAGLGPGDYTLSVQGDGLPAAGISRISPAAVQVKISSVKP